MIACASDFDPQHLDLPNGAPPTFNSDSVDSYEVGAKNNFNNRVKLASSIYYIKWKNIQQTVVPPVCQISFIANLGEATAKGIDMQADVALTDNFTMELATGYTEARYTRDSQISTNPDVLPIVAKGDAISGRAASRTHRSPRQSDSSTSSRLSATSPLQGSTTSTPVRRSGSAPRRMAPREWPHGTVQRQPTIRCPPRIS